MVSMKKHRVSVDLLALSMRQKEMTRGGLKLAPSVTHGSRAEAFRSVPAGLSGL